MGLTNRILFTILILSVYRLGTYVPLSGIDSESLKTLMDSNQRGLLGMFNIFSGGAIKRMAIFALGKFCSQTNGMGFSGAACINSAQLDLIWLSYS